MKHLATLIVIISLVATNLLVAQSITNYTFSATSGTFTAITGTSPTFSGTVDEGYANAIPLNFTFYYMGVSYTTCAVSTNGWLKFGGTVSSADLTNALATGANQRPIIAPLWDDLDIQAFTNFTYETSGSAGSRIFTAQWVNEQWNYSATGNTISFQVKLYEATGVVEFVYRDEGGTVTSGSASIGITATGTGSGNYLSLNGTGTSPTASSTTETTSLNAKPASGQTYTFTPGSVTSPDAPISITFGSITGTGMTVGWTDNSTTETFFNVTRATDAGFTQNVVASTVSSTTTGGTGTTYSASPTGLAFGTTYYFRVNAANEASAPSSNLEGNQATSAGTLSGTKTVGSGGNYDNLTLAFADISTNGLSGNLDLQLITGYPASAETYPITGPTAGSVGNNTLTIYPTATGLSISSSNTTGTLRFDGTKNVVFDGRVNATGSTKDLIIENTATAGYAIQFINDATSNTIKYCTVKGVENTTTNGVIVFSTTTGTTGNDNNTIDNCDIKDGATTPANGIYASGTSGKENSGNTISNCNIYNFFLASNDTRGIYISSNNTDWTISNNKIFQQASRTFTSTALTHYGIQINNTSGNNFTITGNTIGYGASDGTGTTTITGSSNQFRGINLSVGSTTATSVQNNTVNGISQTSSRASTTQGSNVFIGIYVSSGLVNIGNITGNTIGSSSGTGGITIAATSTTSSTVPAIGIFNNGSASTTISNNVIGSITVNTGGSGTYVGFTGIRVSTGSSVTATITGNTIGGTTAGSITSNPVNGLMKGIEHTASIGTISQNIIRNYVSAATNTGTGSSAAIVGIIQSSTAAGQTVSQNSIYSLSSSAASAAVNAIGMYYSGPSTGTNLISRNFIHSIKLATTSTSATNTGLSIAGGASIIQNNMIRLGIDDAGSAITTAQAFTGISKSTSGNNNFFFNSVYIGGSGVGTTATNTSAFVRTSTGTDSIMNNIFVNARSNSSTGGKHYAIGLNATTTATVNYNVFYGAGTGFVLGYAGAPGATDYASLSTWKSGTGLDGSSAFGDPQYIAPAGTSSTVDLHIHATNPTPIEAAGTNIASVTDDYDGETRASFTPVDIGADAGNATGLDLASPTISYTTLSNTTSTSNRAFGSVTITDGSGVNVTSGTAPRVYYKKSTSANDYVGNASTDNGWKWMEANGATTPFDFTFDYSKLYSDGAVAAGDTIQYFVVAQDLAATPNVGINSGSFASTPASVDLAAGHFPISGTINYYRILGTISGTKTVGASGADFTTLTAAVADLNSKELNGAVTIQINADYANTGETFPITILANSGSSASNTITIKPASGATVTVSGSSSSSIFKVNGADYVVFDGTNATLQPASTRDLTISNSSTGTNTAAIWIASLGTGAGSMKVTVKNCNIAAGSNTVTSTFGVFAGGTSISTSGTGDDNDSLTINNNAITKAYYGVYARASASGVNNALTITQNSIGSSSASDYIGKYGLDIMQTTGSDFSQNTIFNFIGTITNPTGMLIGTGVVNTSISGNDIHSLRYTGTTGYGGKGIDVNTGSTSSNLTIANNMIYDLSGDGYNVFSGDAIVGIRLLGTTGGVNIYYNSIHLYGSISRSGATTDKSAALYVVSSATNLDVRNNIFVNSIENTTGVATAYTIYSDAANTAYTSINNNDYVASGAEGVLGYLGANKTTLGDWQTATGQDANSIASDPLFTGNTNLHINTSTSVSPVHNAGAAIGTVTTDFDGESRDGSTPDIGADEFTYALPQAFTLTSPSGPDQGVSGTLSWATSTNATKYVVYLDQNATPTTVLDDNVTGTTKGYSNLLSNTTYYWDVWAKNLIGDSVKASNGPFNFTTVTPPADPTGLTLTDVKKDSIYLTWTDNAADGGNQDSGFVVYRKVDSAPNVGVGSPDSAASVGANPGTGTVNYQDYGLLPNTHYYYRVSARNAQGESNYSQADTTTLAQTPTAPTASNVGYTTMQITLADPAPNPPTTQFAVQVTYGALSSPATTKYLHASGALVDTTVWGTYAEFGGATGVTATGLTISTEYTFNVKARNAHAYETGYGSSLVQSTLGPASLPFKEGFDNTMFPPLGWTQQAIVSGGTNWTRVTAGVNPTQTPYEGAGEAQYNSYNAPAGSHARLYTPPLNFSSTTTPRIGFYMYHYTSTTADSLVVEVSTDGGTTWNRIAMFQRYAATSGWQYHEVTAPGYGNQVINVAFHAWSRDGYNMFIDKVAIGDDILPPTITYTPLGHTQNTGTRQLTSVLKGGVDLRAAGEPRIYYKKNATGSYYASAASTIADTNFTFDIDPTNIGTVTTGDTVLYYVAAQDSSGNSITNPAGTDLAVDPPNGSVAAPSFYIIVDAPLSGDYTVGTSLFNSISGHDVTFERRTRTVTVQVPVEIEATAGDRERQANEPPRIEMKSMEVEQEYFVPMENGTEYKGELFARDNTSPMSGVYATIGAAVADVNLRGVSGPVRFLLLDAAYASESLPITITAIPGASATNTVTIRPNNSVTSTVSGSSASSVFKLSGASYVIIDGSNSEGSDRNLTISNTNGTSSTAAIWLASSGAGAGNTNNTVKNCNISAGNNTSGYYGIGLGGATVGTSGDDNDNNTIQNNVITKCYYGIYASANTTGRNDNLVIQNNTIGSASSSDYVIYRGVYISNATSLTVARNKIYNMITTLGASLSGIDMDNVLEGTISKNTIHDIQSNSFSGYGAYGINIGSSSNNTGIQLENNIIYKVNTINYSASSTTFNPFGIRINGGTNHEVYYNSVSLSGTQFASGGAGTLSAAFLVTSSSVTGLDVRNNIFANSIEGLSGSKSYAIYGVSGTTFGTINSNDYYGYGSYGILGFLGTEKTTLADWKTATGQDGSSVAGDPLYTSATNLHIVNSAGFYSPVANIGSTISGITTDYDGDTRSSAPDAGADEFALPPPGAFTLISPTGASQPVSVTFYWHPAAGATRYDVYAGTDNPPMTLVENNVADTQYIFSGNPLTTYFWRVYAENPDSNGGSRTLASNAPLSFTTVDAPLTPSNVTLETGVSSPGAQVLRDRIVALQNEYAKTTTKEEAEAIEKQISGLTKQLSLGAYMVISWTDNAANEDSFLVYGKLGSVPNVGPPYTDLIGTVAASAGTGGTPMFIHDPLALDAHYYYRVSAIGNGIEGGFDGADTTTLADKPNAPTFSDIHWNKFTIAVSTNDNPATVQFAVYNSESGKYVTADGDYTNWSLTPVWQTYDQWGGASGLELTGLTRGTVYTFNAMARNSNLIETLFGDEASQQTTFEFGSSATYTRHPNKAIPDNSLTGIRDTIALPAIGGIVKTMVSLDSLTHTYVGDLSMTLTAPNGQSIYLMARPGSGTTGSSGDNFIGTYLDDDASRQIESILSTEAPYTGSWRPDSQGVQTYLSAFNGSQPAGNWILFIQDGATSDVGTLLQWSLHIDTKSQPNSVRVKKVQDHDGDVSTTADQVAKSWYLEIRADSLAGNVLASGETDSIGVPAELMDGIFYALEADSANGWAHLGYLLNGTPYTSASNNVQLDLSGGDQHPLVTFVNFLPNHLMARKFQDADGDFGTTGDRTAKFWGLKLYRTSVSEENLVTSSGSGELDLPSLGDGTYIVAEADSSGWGAIGKIVNGNPVTGSAQYDTFTVANGQTHTVDFVNVKYSGITVNKFRDVNGGSVTFDEAKGWYLAIHKDSCNGAVVANGNAATVSALNIIPGTYYVTEEDSAGWTHAGYRVDGGIPVAGTTSCVPVVVGVAEQHTVDFANFHPNTITVRKFEDPDGNFSTTTGRVAKAWYMELYQTSVSPANLVTSGTSTTISASGLGDGAYIAAEADSLGWAHLGRISNGVDRPGSARFDTIVVSDGQSYTTDFVNSPSNSITVRKWRDPNGGVLNMTEARTWFLAVRQGSCSGTIVASGNTTELTVSNLHAGTYYITEADSSGWMHMGYIVDGDSTVSGDLACAQVTVANGEARTIDFVNFHGNTVTVRKFRDTDGGEPSFDAPLNWALTLKNDADEVIGLDEDGELSLSDLIDGQYTACEAESVIWSSVGYRLNGSIVAGETECVTFTVADGQTVAVDFANRLKDTVKFFSATANTFALTFDAKGALKSIPKKPARVQFSFNIKPDSMNITDLHLEFGTAIDTTNYDLTITPTPATLVPVVKSGLKKWDATFSPVLDSNIVVSVSGYGSKGALQKVGSYWWTRNNVIVGKKKKVTTFVQNQLRLPMPNIHNLGEETFAQGGFASTGGMIVGVPHLEAPSAYGWVFHKKYSEGLKSLVKKTKTGYLVHDSAARCFDFFKNGKILVKKQSNLPPDKYDNKLFADLIAFRLNIAASAMNKTTNGFGELKYVDDGHPLNGKMLKEIAAFTDTLLTNCSSTTVGDLTPEGFDSVISKVNSAFATTFDTLSWGSKLVLKPAIRISDVTFLERDTTEIAATIIPLENEISQLPEKYELYQNFPNPFNPVTMINFDLPQPSKVTLKIYNLLGQEVMAVYDGVEMDEGTQEIELNAQPLSTGVYFYRLEAQSLDEESGVRKFIETKKLVLVK